VLEKSFNFYYQVLCELCLHSVLWHCWLHVRKNMQPVKLSHKVLAWLSVWSKVHMICIWSSWCHCHTVISYFIRIQIGLTFLLPSAQVVLEKRPLNGCLSVLYELHLLDSVTYIQLLFNRRCFLVLMLPKGYSIDFKDGLWKLWYSCSGVWLFRGQMWFPTNVVKALMAET